MNAFVIREKCFVYAFMYTSISKQLKSNNTVTVHRVTAGLTFTFFFTINVMNEKGKIIGWKYRGLKCAS